MGATREINPTEEEDTVLTSCHPWHSSNTWSSRPRGVILCTVMFLQALPFAMACFGEIIHIQIIELRAIAVHASEATKDKPLSPHTCRAVSIPRVDSGRARVVSSRLF